MAVTLNAVRIAVGRRSGARTSIRTMHDDKYGLASGRAKTIATLEFLRQRRSRFSRPESVVHRLRLGCRHGAVGAEAVSERRIAELRELSGKQFSPTEMLDLLKDVACPGHALTPGTIIISNYVFEAFRTCGRLKLADV